MLRISGGWSDPRGFFSPSWAVYCRLDRFAWPFGRLVDAFRALLDASWTLLGALGRLLDASWTLLAALGRLLDASWTLLGRSWPSKLAFWSAPDLQKPCKNHEKRCTVVKFRGSGCFALQALLDASWSPLGRQLGRTWGPLGGFGDQLGANLSALGANLEALGVNLRPTWTLLELSWTHFGPTWTHSGPI